MNQFEMKKLAYQSQLRNRALQVLLYLIDRSDQEQTCFPAVPTISRELHISISTVKRAMRELVEAGYVKKESRFRKGNRGQTSNLYTLFTMVREQGKDCVESKKTEQESTEESGRNTEWPPLVQMDIEDHAATESTGTWQDVELNMESMSASPQKDYEDAFSCDVDGGGGHFALPLNCSSNRKQKAEKKYYRECIGTVIAKIRKFGQLNFCIRRALWILDATLKWEPCKSAKRLYYNKNFQKLICENKHCMQCIYKCLEKGYYL